MSQGFDINVFVLQLVVILMGLSLHEFSHAYFADLAGDPTPRMMGRVTLNPLKHLDPIGTIMLIFTSLSGIGFGWGKPVMVDPRRMRNPRWDHFISVAAGPASNLLQAVVYAGVLRLTGAPGYLGVFLLFGVYINLGLAVFNLVPLGPLDGHWLAGAFLPEPARTHWYIFNRTYGSFALLALIFIPGSNGSLISQIVGPVVMNLASHLLGVNG